MEYFCAKHWGDKDKQKKKYSLPSRNLCFDMGRQYIKGRQEREGEEEMVSSLAVKPRESGHE